MLDASGGTPARQWNRFKLHTCPPLPDPEAAELGDALRCNECGRTVYLNQSLPSINTGQPGRKVWVPVT